MCVLYKGHARVTHIDTTTSTGAHHHYHSLEAAVAGGGMGAGEQSWSRTRMDSTSASYSQGLPGKHSGLRGGYIGGLVVLVVLVVGNG